MTKQVLTDTADIHLSKEAEVDWGFITDTGLLRARRKKSLRVGRVTGAEAQSDVAGQLSVDCDSKVLLGVNNQSLWVCRWGPANPDLLRMGHSCGGGGSILGLLCLQHRGQEPQKTSVHVLSI